MYDKSRRKALAAEGAPDDIVFLLPGAQLLLASAFQGKHVLRGLRMLTEEAKKSGKEFCGRLFESGISAAAICEISGMLSDYNVEQEQTFKDLLEATKDCKTDEEFLAAVRTVLEKED